MKRSTVVRPAIGYSIANARIYDIFIVRQAAEVDGNYHSTVRSVM
jgi:hypothetical protein